MIEIVTTRVRHGSIGRIPPARFAEQHRPCKQRDPVTFNPRTPDESVVRQLGAGQFGRQAEHVHWRTQHDGEMYLHLSDLCIIPNHICYLPGSSERSAERRIH